MARWETHRTDANAEAIYAAARKLGFSVEKINRPVDALFGIYGQSVAVEVKTATGALRRSQVKFFKTFKGLAVSIRTTGDVIALYREMRARHDRLFPELQRPDGSAIPPMSDARSRVGRAVQSIGRITKALNDG